MFPEMTCPFSFSICIEPAPENPDSEVFRIRLVVGERIKAGEWEGGLLLEERTEEPCCMGIPC